MQGVVQKCENNRNGNMQATIDGKSYFFARSLTSYPTPGAKIDFEYQEFGDDRGKGKPRSIQQWKPVTNGAGQAQTGSTITELNILQSVSNIVGHACSAGSVKAPEELEKWCVAARMGLTRAMKGKRAEDESEPDFDDEIPF